MNDRSKIIYVTRGMSRNAILSMVGTPDEAISMQDALNMAKGYIISESYLDSLQGIQMWVYNIDGKEWKVFFEDNKVSDFERPS